MPVQELVAPARSRRLTLGTASNARLCAGTRPFRRTWASAELPVAVNLVVDRRPWSRRRREFYERGCVRGDQRSVAKRPTDQFTPNPGPKSARGRSLYRQYLQELTPAAGTGLATRERVFRLAGRWQSVREVLSARALSDSLVNSRPRMVPLSSPSRSGLSSVESESKPGLDSRLEHIPNHRRQLAVEPLEGHFTRQFFRP